jgi:hypothetical protein
MPLFFPDRALSSPSPVHHELPTLVADTFVDDSERAYDRAQNNDQFDHQSSFGHEALAGAASFGAFKLFEDHQRKEGS